MLDRITPPKIVPYALVSFGSSSSFIAGMRSLMPISILLDRRAFHNCPAEARERRRVGGSSAAAAAKKCANGGCCRPKTVYHEFGMSTMTNGKSAPLDTSTSSTRAWSVHDSSELYEVPRW